jgi:3-deoxy-D-manno-octulosonate 8-phosphate phosphatase KdsC-like HAD superfamily phosphatase
MKVVGYAFCPMDSPSVLKDHCGSSNIVPRNGGENVVAKMLDMLLERGLVPDCSMQDIEALDKKEKF